jgi:RNA polymerase sigma-70 factor (ECF subfamily)
MIRVVSKMPNEKPAESRSAEVEPTARALRGRRTREVAELIGRIRTGIDAEESFRLLFERYYRLIRHYFAERGMDSDRCEDLTQETFVAVYRGLPSFRGDSGFDTWLFSIARRIFAGAVRREVARRRQLAEVPLEEAADTPCGANLIEPLHAAIDRERLRQLHRSIGGMPEQMRRCATLRLSYELKYREIAEVLNISEDAVRVQLARARQRLRRELSDTLDGVTE